MPGDDLALYSAPLWRDTPLAGRREAFAARFWGDGTPRLTAYEYQGLLQSRCAQRGALTCTSCHGMHEGDPRGQIRARFARRAASDGMCTGATRRWPRRPPLAAHTHHDPAGEGARCVGCHMPRIVYGVLDVHRSHRIEIPNRRARRHGAGRPDACTLCHVEGLRRPARGPPIAPAAGRPVARAVAADALGRAAARSAATSARAPAALLEA